MQRNLQNSGKKAKNPRPNQRKKTRGFKIEQANKEVAQICIVLLIVSLAFLLGIRFEKARVKAHKFEEFKKFEQNSESFCARFHEIKDFDQIRKILVD